jgi:hypothetical protein
LIDSTTQPFHFFDEEGRDEAQENCSGGAFRDGDGTSECGSYRYRGDDAMFASASDSPVNDAMAARTLGDLLSVNLS